MEALPFIDAQTLAASLSWPQAIDVLKTALGAGLDLGTAAPRSAVPTRHGELLLMPAESPAALGVKVLGIAPANPARGLPRIQALYVLFTADTLTPVALLDGAALTAVRTPAVSALAVQRLARGDAANLTVFGSGPQAFAHVHALRAVRPVRRVAIIGRDGERAQALCARLRAGDVDAVCGIAADVGTADIVVCATTARAPLFAAELLAADACVVAVGSHEPDACELGADVFARATRVVVEDRATALREAGDVIMAVAAGALTADALVALGELPDLPFAEGITVFKSVGMGWQDLAVAEAAWAAVITSH